MKTTKRKLALAAADILTVSGIVCLIWCIVVTTRWGIHKNDILLRTMEKMSNPLIIIVFIALVAGMSGVVWRDCLFSDKYPAYEYPYEASKRAFVTSILLSLMVTGAVCAGFGSMFFIQQKKADEYRPENIICVYPDSGNATDASVKYKTKAEGLTEELHAHDLGYTNVVVKDGITKPEDELEPEGKTLVIPRSYLKERE